VVVGITTAVPADPERQGADEAHVAFALPIDIARAVADDLIARGEASHPWLGISGSDVDAAAAVTTGAKQGALLHDVTTGAAADTAGLRPGDVVVEWEGHPVRSMAQLVILLRGRHPGEEVHLAVVRAGQHLERTLTIGDRPANADSEPTAPSTSPTSAG
jgi:putative serine protease PepD